MTTDSAFRHRVALRWEVWPTTEIKHFVRVSARPLRSSHLHDAVELLDERGDRLTRLYVYYWGRDGLELIRKRLGLPVEGVWDPESVTP